MAVFHLSMLALIQGLTEFLPVSSSGHLVLVPHLTGFPDHGQVIDVAVHVGTLGAVMVYFRSDVFRIANGFLRFLSGDRNTEDAQLFLGLVVATVPVVIVGLLFRMTGIADMLRSVSIVAWATIVFAIVLFVCDRNAPRREEARNWTIRQAWILGLWQVLALIPGTSRSGITISGARWLGYDRESSVRFAMLMSIPVIFASGTLLGIEVVASADARAARDGAVAALLSFVSGLCALTFMMRLLRHTSFTPYVIYRVCLGILLLWIAYT